MRASREGLAAALIGLLLVLPVEIIGVKSGVIAGYMTGLLAVPIVAVLTAVVLIVAKVGRGASLDGAAVGMFGVDLVVSFGGAVIGLVILGPLLAVLLTQLGLG